MPGTNNYDAIVIGRGIMAYAKELCEKDGRHWSRKGRNVEYKDYSTANLSRWELPHRGDIHRKKNNPLISAGSYDESTQHFFVKMQTILYRKTTDWVRGYQVGGKSYMGPGLCKMDLDLSKRYGR
jgi:hypothetical protein